MRVATAWGVSVATSAEDNGDHACRPWRGLRENNRFGATIRGGWTSRATSEGGRILQRRRRTTAATHTHSDRDEGFARMQGRYHLTPACSPARRLRTTAPTGVAREREFGAIVRRRAPRRRRAQLCATAATWIALRTRGRRRSTPKRSPTPARSTAYDGRDTDRPKNERSGRSTAALVCV